MFTFFKFTCLLAFASVLVASLPTPNAGVEVVKRNADPATVPAGSLSYAAREALPEANIAAALEARQLPVSVPDAISTATSLLGPIFDEIDSAVASGAPVATLVSLWSSAFTVVQGLTSNIGGLASLGSGALGGLSVTAVAQLFTTLITLVTTKLQTTVSALPSGSTSAFTSIFTSVTNELVAAIQAIVSTIPGIGSILSPLLGTVVNTLSSLAGILAAPLSLVLTLATLLLTLL